MRCISFAVLLFVGLTSSLGVTVNETTPLETGEVQPSAIVPSRRGRQIEVVELLPPSRKIKRQIIKIPPNVSKVKLLQPPLNLRYNRAPQQFSRFPPVYRSGDPWRTASKKSQSDPDYEAGSFGYEPKKVKKILKKPLVREVSPEEFYNGEEFGFDREERTQRQQRVQTQRNHKVVKKVKVKKPKNALGEYLTNYEVQQEEELLQGYDPAGSTIHMQQVPAPNLLQDNSFDNYSTGLKVKKLPTKGRQVQSLFSQQYTTHNPHVTTNFGLTAAAAQINGMHYGTFVDASPYEFPALGNYGQPVTAASDQVLTALPVNTPGIQVIQPPQFRDVTVSHPSYPSRLMSSSTQQKEETSQKATIKDILERDCPGFDTKGYCDSPPRYPMQQIKNMIKQCSSLMEVMNTQPFEEHYEMYGFAKRSDYAQESENKTSAAEPEGEASSWSRSSNDGLTTCNSDVELTEPGYAKEVNSGRWFVIVQHPDTTIQRIATDTCRSPGKSCGGLSEMKCTKILSKSTRCVQRYTYQRLISWDPESPEECPRMRVFRFPSACVCHLGVP